MPSRQWCSQRLLGTRRDPIVAACASSRAHASRTVAAARHGWFPESRSPPRLRLDGQRDGHRRVTVVRDGEHDTADPHRPGRHQGLPVQADLGAGPCQRQTRQRCAWPGPQLRALGGRHHLDLWEEQAEPANCLVDGLFRRPAARRGRERAQASCLQRDPASRTHPQTPGSPPADECSPCSVVRQLGQARSLGRMERSLLKPAAVPSPHAQHPAALRHVQPHALDHCWHGA